MLDDQTRESRAVSVPLLYGDDPEFHYEDFVPDSEPVDAGVVARNAVALIASVVLVLSPLVLIVIAILTSTHHGK